MKDFFNQYKSLSFSILSSNFIYIIFSLLIGTIIANIFKSYHFWEVSLFSIINYLLLVKLTSKSKAASNFGQALFSLGIFVIILALAALIKGQVLDYSFDGQMYHQEAVILLKEGWNPIHNPFVNLENTVYGITFYPKTIWYLQAYFFMITNNLEASKIVDILLAAIIIFKAIPKLRLLKYSITQQIIIFSLVCITPISISQFFSFYIDSSVYFLILLIIIIGHDISLKSDQRNASIIQLILVSAILANTKFTGLYFTFMFTGGVMLYLAIKREWSFPSIVKSGLSIIVLTIVIGINPYFTNLIEYKNPVYPLMNGSKQYDIIGSQMSDNFANQPYLKKLYYSYFGVSTRMIPEDKIEMRKLGIPRPIEISQFINTGETTRINGFGLLFSLTLAISLLVLLRFLLFNKKFNYLHFIIFLIITSTLLNPTSWWARLSPATYLLPVVVIMILWSERKIIPMVIGYTLCFLLIINNIMIVGPVVLSQITNQYIAKQQLDLIKQGLKTSKKGIAVDFSPMWNSARQRLKDNNIPYSDAKLSTRESYNLLNTPARFLFIDSIPTELQTSLSELQNKSFKENYIQLIKFNH